MDAQANLSLLCPLISFIKLDSLRGLSASFYNAEPSLKGKIIPLRQTNSIRGGIPEKLVFVSLLKWSLLYKERAYSFFLE